MNRTFMTTQNSVVSDRSTAIAKHSQKKIASDSGFKGPLWLTTKKLTIPKFTAAQRVYFVGGVGTIKNCRPEAGTWTYVIEMELGPEPEMGRVGSETTILLHEADLREVMN
jgi:hypothetical protein